MLIPSPKFVLLFVKDPLASAAFYKKIFQMEPIEQASTFAMFAFPNGIMLGLWSPLTADPPAEVKSGGCEIAFCEDNVDEMFEQWKNLDVPIAQPPTDMDFARTFVALDPDGHRIRVMRLTEAHV